MKYRPSPWFLRIVISGVVLSVAFWFGVMPEIREAAKVPIPGEIVFPDKPGTNSSGQSRAASDTPLANAGAISNFKDWFGETFDDLVYWKHNPWKPEGGRPFPGTHFLSMLASEDPMERAKAHEIQRLAEATLKRLMERYPELAVEAKNVPDEKNAFLKWLDFADRIKATHKNGQIHKLDFDTSLRDSISGTAPWDPAAAREWLSKNASLMEEIRAMGLMPEASTTGIPVERYSFSSASLAMDCGNALLMEARLAAERGDVQQAMDSIQALRGFAELPLNVESPTLLGATVSILIRMNLEQKVFSEILPSLPEGSRNPEAWQAVVNPQVGSPADYARLLKGEWSVVMRQWILPPVHDHQDPLCPPDSGALLDAYSRPFAETIRAHENARLGEEPVVHLDAKANAAGLSKHSRQMIEMLLVGSQSWNKGMIRSQNSYGLTIAAFSVMKGEPLPLDPMRGKPYRWDEATRTLSMPAGEEFEKMDIKPIVVPTR